ncbi:MAG: nucleotidyl transferase AbiEii/AbiGii toxin family protein [Chlorobiaceae bacterium]|nr:nucleotidyl transferase AbiEii/AbiGii toxin family protein [Chlorobiaceae bacterium]
MKVMRQLLARLASADSERITNGVKSAMQDVVLDGLQRNGFFEYAVFCGDSCLRIAYGSPRHSGNLDFCLLESNGDPPLESYFNVLTTEFASLGMDVEITLNKKMVRLGAEAFLLRHRYRSFELAVIGDSALKIPLHLYTLPFKWVTIEEKQLFEPRQFSIRCFALSDLFILKMNTLLFSSVKSEVSGRDWFDFEWFITNRVPLNLSHLIGQFLQPGGLNAQRFSEQEFYDRLESRINAIDIAVLKKDVSPLIKSPEALNVWSQSYFRELTNQLIIIRQ